MCSDRLKFIIAALFFLCVLSVMTACKTEKRNHIYSDVPDANISEGRTLASQYCQSCHALPDPSLADAATWINGILPQMAPRLGIFRYNHQNYPSERADRNLPKDFYPAKPMLTDQDWQYILDYYGATSPDSLKTQDSAMDIEKNLPFFKVVEPTGTFTNPATIMVRIAKDFPGSAITVADAMENTITCFDSLLQIKDKVILPGPAVQLIPDSSNRWIVCDIGVLNPNNGRFGKLLSVPAKPVGKKDSTRTLCDSLRRPVQITEADLNRDGRKDLLVCEFGNMLGSLSWFEKETGGGYTKHILRPSPGAIRAEINDYNHDGLPDIWCLFAQGDESIMLFTNLGNGKFSTKQILRFPPIYGSSYFELEDFNGDGFPDIIYTCGDNADYSTVLKPYHGVYIYQNDGRNNFSQKYFFPMNGAYKAMARDFDGDGDLDIACISFFPDFSHRPEEGFIYLENRGGYSFKPYSFPEASKGRWLTMDVGDMDGDGDADIIIGNLSMAPSFITPHPDWKKGPPFIVLKNQSR
jgi:FG-GAP-like repeat